VPSASRSLWPGWGVERIAGAWVGLMARLGCQRYGAQGSDLGTLPTSEPPDHQDSLGLARGALGPDHRYGHAAVAGVGDGVGCASRPPRRLPVPNGKQEVTAIHGAMVESCG
jgi:hypothetical protein